MDRHAMNYWALGVLVEERGRGSELSFIIFSIKVIWRIFAFGESTVFGEKKQIANHAPNLAANDLAHEFR